MKKTLATFTGIALLAGMAFAAPPFPRHPNLRAAHNHLAIAMEKITAAQKANEFDMGGHAHKAKELIEQAQKELVAAAEAANEGKK